MSGMRTLGCWCRCVLRHQHSGFYDIGRIHCTSYGSARRWLVRGFRVTDSIVQVCTERTCAAEVVRLPISARVEAAGSASPVTQLKLNRPGGDLWSVVTVGTMGIIAGTSFSVTVGPGGTLDF